MSQQWSRKLGLPNRFNYQVKLIRVSITSCDSLYHGKLFFLSSHSNWLQIYPHLPSGRPNAAKFIKKFRCWKTPIARGGGKVQLDTLLAFGFECWGKSLHFRTIHIAANPGSILRKDGANKRQIYLQYILSEQLVEVLVCLHFGGKAEKMGGNRWKGTQICSWETAEAW